MERIVDRFDKYMSFSGLNDNIVTKDLSFSVGLIGKSRKEGRDLSKNATEAILNFYVDINPVWLKTGEGSMLKESVDSSKPRADIAGTIVATDDEKYSEAVKAGLSLTPEYSTVFHGGHGTNTESAGTVAHWLIPNAPKDAVIIPMLGNSMSPRFSSGSRLLVRPIEFFTATSITFGDVFAVVVQDEYGYEPSTHIKILRRHKDVAKEATHWVARSVNRDEYDDFDIDISRVSKLYKVIGSVDLFGMM